MNIFSMTINKKFEVLSEVVMEIPALFRELVLSFTFTQYSRFFRLSNSSFIS